MIVLFVFVFGFFIFWYFLLNICKYVYYFEGWVGFGIYIKVFYKINYYIFVMYRYLFGIYFVEVNNFRGLIVKIYIWVLKNFFCLGNLFFLFFFNLLSKIFLENDKLNRMSEIVFLVFFYKG